MFAYSTSMSYSPLMKTLLQHTPEHLPPEMLLDPHHPANDDYIKSVHQIQRQIVLCSSKMKPKHVDIVKHAFKGFSQVDTATKLSCSSATVGKALKSPDGLRLRALLVHHQAAVDGPNESQRINMLWRIAIDNEILHSKTSVAAIAEMNRMTITQFDQQNMRQGNQPITITINQEMMPKGTLDE